SWQSPTGRIGQPFPTNEGHHDLRRERSIHFRSRKSRPWSRHARTRRAGLRGRTSRSRQPRRPVPAALRCVLRSGRQALLQELHEVLRTRFTQRILVGDVVLCPHRARALHPADDRRGGGGRLGLERPLCLTVGCRHRSDRHRRRAHGGLRARGPRALHRRRMASDLKSSGRASRSEYWWATLFCALIALVPYILLMIGVGVAAASVSNDPYASPSGAGIALIVIGGGLMAVFGLAVLVPSIAVAWR